MESNMKMMRFKRVVGINKDPVKLLKFQKIV